MSTLSSALNRRQDDLADLVTDAQNAAYGRSVVAAIEVARIAVVDAMARVVQEDEMEQPRLVGSSGHDA